MSNSKKLPFLLIIISLFLLVALNIGVFVKKKHENKIVAPKDVVREKYLQTLINKYDPEADWNPVIEASMSNQPEIAGKSGIIVDPISGVILFGLNSNQKMPIASLVKIMTAVVALEHRNLEDEIVVSDNASSVGENSMGLTSGEVYPLEELLYGMMLNSGNDSATAIAEGVAGDVPTFVKWMNIKAEDLGLKDTYFADPDGLNDSSYSTAVDLAKLTRYAVKNPEFKEIVKTVEHEILSTEKHKYIPLYNQTNLLTTYPGVLGVKTGYTEEAGLCLVTYAQNDGKELIGVVLDSIDRKGDMIRMLDHGFGSLGVKIVHHLLE